MSLPHKYQNQPKRLRWKSILNLHLTFTSSSELHLKMSSRILSWSCTWLLGHRSSLKWYLIIQIQHSERSPVKNSQVHKRQCQVWNYCENIPEMSSYRLIMMDISTPKPSKQVLALDNLRVHFGAEWLDLVVFHKVIPKH
jgi:hypothetical protein